MFKANASMKVRKVGTEVAIIDIFGEVNSFAENALIDAYTQAAGGGAQAILLNFSHLEYMNSSGIGLLVTLLIRTQRQRQRLLAYGLDEHYRQIFELTRLSEAIQIYPSEGKALEDAVSASQGKSSGPVGPLASGAAASR